MTIPTISTLPVAPARTDAPATFITRADAFLAAMVVMQSELNTSIGAMNTDIAGANTDATAAAASASAAATSESNASTSETNAATSETNAASSAAAAASTYDQFDDRYLGSKASDPAVDNDGNALLTGALYFNTTSDDMKVYTGSTWKVTGLNPDSPTFAGTVTAAAIDVTGNIEVSGGVYLGGTGSANLLDDYEEGTWTPTILSAGGGSNGSALLINCTYTKTGNRVLLTGTLLNINTTSMTAGGFRVGGLPFAAVTATNSQNLVSLGGNQITTDEGGMYGLVSNSGTLMLIYNEVAAAAKPLVTIADITSGDGDLFISMMYQTTA